MTNEVCPGSNPRTYPPLSLAVVETVLIGIDFQQGFGPHGREYTPHALEAVAAFRRAAEAWRRNCGRVLHVYSSREPSDFLRDDGTVDESAFSSHPMRSGSPSAEFYPHLVQS